MLKLTWMDAKVGDWVVTPRIGKPVEVNALWYNALRVMQAFSRRLGKTKTAKRFEKSADQVRASFVDRFWFEDGGYLFDVVDGPEVDPLHAAAQGDSRLRPNQIIAVSLPFSPVQLGHAKRVVDACLRELWTPYGLRSLSTEHAEYVGRYTGGALQRDGSYHQGTVWAWLLGPFVIAHLKVYGSVPVARSYLESMQYHLRDACIGSVSEIFDGDPPYLAKGCFAQAWSVSELLRAWFALTDHERAAAAKESTPEQVGRG